MKILSLFLAAAAATLLLFGCSSTNTGRYFENDGPPASGEADAGKGGDVVPRIERHGKATSRPYTVMGQTFYPLTGDRKLTQTGIASWYGKQFHGRKTATGEIYDMFKLSAAHPTMQLPSYAKVTNIENGRSVIVRVNDRGPFIGKRIIDMSYAAAVKLGYHKKGTARVKVERITNREIAAGYKPKSDPPPEKTTASVHTARSSTIPAPGRTSLAGAGAAAAAPAKPAQASSSSPPATGSYRGGPVTIRGWGAYRAEEDSMSLLAAADVPDRDAMTPAYYPGSSPESSYHETAPAVIMSLEVSAADPEISAAAKDLDAAERRMQQIRDREFERSAKAMPPVAPAGTGQGWSVQIGAFRSEANAREAAAHAEAVLSQAGMNEEVRVVRDGPLCRVLIGGRTEVVDARSLSAAVAEQLGSSTIIVQK